MFRPERKICGYDAEPLSFSFQDAKDTRVLADRPIIIEHLIEQDSSRPKWKRRHNVSVVVAGQDRNRNLRRRKRWLVSTREPTGFGRRRHEAKGNCQIVVVSCGRKVARDNDQIKVRIVVHIFRNILEGCRIIGRRISECDSRPVRYRFIGRLSSRLPRRGDVDYIDCLGNPREMQIGDMKNAKGGHGGFRRSLSFDGIC